MAPACRTRPRRALPPRYRCTAVGKALCEHPAIESIHLTGSADTYNAIVWGGKDAAVRAV